MSDDSLTLHNLSCIATLTLPLHICAVVTPYLGTDCLSATHVNSINLQPMIASYNYMQLIYSPRMLLQYIAIYSLIKLRGCSISTAG